MPKLGIRIGVEGAGKAKKELDGVSDSVDGLGKKQKKAASSAKDFAIGGYVSEAAQRATDALIDETKAVLEFDQALGVIQAKMGASTAEMQVMRDLIIDTSNQFGLNRDEVMGAIGVYQDFGGIVKDGIPSLGMISTIARATGTSIKSLATANAVLIGQMNLNPKQQGEMLAMLASQADAATVAMADVARVMPKIFGTGEAMFGEKNATREVGELLQIAGTTTGGNAEEAATKSMAVMRDLTQNAGKIKKAFGVDVFGADGKMKPMAELMGQIAKSSKGVVQGKKGLSSFFTADSLPVVLAFAKNIDLANGKVLEGSRLAKLMASSTKGSMDAMNEAMLRAMNGIGSMSNLLSSLGNIGRNSIAGITQGMGFVAEQWSYLGKSVDEFIGKLDGATSMTDVLANNMLWMTGGREAGAARAAAAAKTSGVDTLAAQGRAMMEMASRGIGTASMTMAGGKSRSVDLEYGKIVGALVQKATEQGLQTEQLIIQLKMIGQNLGLLPKKLGVTIAPGAGIDSSQIRASRGK